MNSEFHCWEWPRRMSTYATCPPSCIYVGMMNHSQHSSKNGWAWLQNPSPDHLHSLKTTAKVKSTGHLRVHPLIFQMVKDPKRGWVTPKVRSPWGRGKQQSNVALVLCLHHTSKTDAIVLLHWNFSQKVYTITYWTPYSIKQKFLNL